MDTDINITTPPSNVVVRLSSATRVMRNRVNNMFFYLFNFRFNPEKVFLWFGQKPS